MKSVTARKRRRKETPSGQAELSNGGEQLDFKQQERKGDQTGR